MAEHNPHSFTTANLEQVVLQIILARRSRRGLFPPVLFSDPAWDLLLVLFLAGLRPQRMTISELAEDTALSPGAAARWLDALDQHGLLSRRSDPRDARRTFIELSARGADSMRQWVEDWIKGQSGGYGDGRVIDLLTRVDRRD
jgi:DNA-binding MarR family transcriptional regulator